MRTFSPTTFCIRIITESKKTKQKKQNKHKKTTATKKNRHQKSDLFTSPDLDLAQLSSRVHFLSLRSDINPVQKYTLRQCH